MWQSAHFFLVLDIFPSVVKTADSLIAPGRAGRPLPCFVALVASHHSVRTESDELW